MNFYLCFLFLCVKSQIVIFGGININKDILYWKSFYYTILYNFKYISVLEEHVRILLFMKNTNLSFPHFRKTTASRSFYYYVFKTDHRFSTTHFQVLFINLHIVLICLIFLSVIYLNKCICLCAHVHTCALSSHPHPHLKKNPTYLKGTYTGVWDCQKSLFKVWDRFLEIIYKKVLNMSLIGKSTR